MDESSLSVFYFSLSFMFNLKKAAIKSRPPKKEEISGEISIEEKDVASNMKQRYYAEQRIS